MIFGYFLTTSHPNQVCPSFGLANWFTISWGRAITSFPAFILRLFSCRVTLEVCCLCFLSDRATAIPPAGHFLHERDIGLPFVAEGAGLEPARVLPPLGFQPSALPLDYPSVKYVVGDAGIEPACPFQRTDLQSVNDPYALITRIWWERANSLVGPLPRAVCNADSHDLSGGRRGS